MRKFIILAAILLLAQVGLVVALNLGSNGKKMAAVDAVFLNDVVADADSLKITDGDGNIVELTGKDGNWVLPVLQGASAGQNMVVSLLEKLSVLKQGFTVATSSEAAKRFKVADDVFERHVVLQKSGETVADFYLGTSPGFRQVHARKQGDTGVVTLALSTFEFDTDPAKWLDTTILQLPSDDIVSITLPDVVLKKEDDNWKLEGNVDGELDMDAVEDLVSRISSLTLQDVIGRERSEELFAGDSQLSMGVGLKDGLEIAFNFVQDDEDSYGLKRSDEPLVYRIHKIVVEGLSGFTRDKLLGRTQDTQDADVSDALTEENQEPSSLESSN